MDDKSSITNVDGPSALKIELHVPRPDIEPIWEAKEILRNGKEKYSSLRQICKEMDVRQMLAYIRIYSPVF